MDPKPLKMLIAGEGGQGIQALGEIIAVAADLNKKYGSYIPNFGVEQRGGVSIAFVILSDKPIIYPKFKTADYLIVLSDRSLERIKAYATPHTKFLYDCSIIDYRKVAKIFPKLHTECVPATNCAEQTLQELKTMNIVTLGGIYNLLGRFLTKESLFKAMDLRFAHQYQAHPKLKNLNRRAFALGTKKYQVCSARPVGSSIPVSYTSGTKEVITYPDKCKSCGLCIEQCPVKVLSWSKNLGFLGRPVPQCDIKNCIACNICDRVCPDSAIELRKKNA